MPNMQGDHRAWIANKGLAPTASPAEGPSKLIGGGA